MARRGIRGHELADGDAVLAVRCFFAVGVSELLIMAREAGRDPASLSISTFRVPPDLERLKRYRELGIDRVVFSLPGEKDEKILPILDRWAELQRRLAA